MYTLTPVVKRLLIITGAVHILALVLLNFNNNFIENSFSLVPKKVLENFQIWRLLSYGFLHDLNGFWHLLGNCLALFFFGCPLEQRWGARSFLKFFLLSIVCSGFFLILLSPMLAAHYAVPTVGNSGAVYALLVAYAMIYPNAIIYLIFFPIRAKVLIIGMIALTFLYAIHPTSQGVSWPVHLGGAATAYLLLTGTWRPKYLLEKLKLWRYNQKLKKSKSKLRVIRTHKNDDDNNRTLH